MPGAAEPSAYAKRVLDVVERIPPGRVMSYGDVRDFLGESSARAVGMVMYRWGSEVSWHRVVFADGSLPYGHEETALALLAAEGTPLVGERVDMAAARWDGR